MKKAILPFTLGIVLATAGLFVASKVTGACPCSPICLCNPCNCGK